MYPSSPKNGSETQTNQQNLTTDSTSAASNSGTTIPTDAKSSSTLDKTSALHQVNASTSSAGMVANPKGTTLPSQVSAQPNPPIPVSTSATPVPQSPVSHSATPSPAMMNKFDALDKSVLIKLTDAQKTKLNANTGTINIGLLHMKQLKEMLSGNGTDAAKFTCAFDSRSPWGFSIKQIVSSDTSFHQKVMTQDEKAGTYFGFMSIFNNQHIAGNPKLDDITMEELTSTLVELTNKITSGEYITGADLRPIVFLIVEDLSSPLLPRPSTPADFAHIDLKEMKTLKKLLETAKSPDEVVNIRSEPQAASKVAIELYKPDTNTTGMSFPLLNDLKLSIERRSINQTVTTLKSMLSKWKTDSRISKDTQDKIHLIEKLFHGKKARSANITVADLSGIVGAITTDLKEYKSKSRH